MPQLALLCYRTAHHVAGADPAALPAAVDAAFDHLTELPPARQRIPSPAVAQFVTAELPSTPNIPRREE